MTGLAAIRDAEPRDRADDPGHPKPPEPVIDDPQNLAYAPAYVLMGHMTMADTERHVRLFRNGRNQALRIPREFELEGDEAVLRKEGDRLIIEPVRKGRLLAVLASLEPLAEAFPDVDEDLTPLDDAEL